MLRQIYIYRKRDLLYYRKFGKAIQEKNFDSILEELEEEAFGKNPNEMNSYIYFKYRIAYLTDRALDLIFIFVTGLTDDPENVEKELIRCKKEFLNIFEEIIKKDKYDNLTFQVFDPTTDSIHKNLRPKIALIGFSGVGKTTITRLIKAEEIPMKHIPTITGDIATIKIGKLHFHLWDFAGQEQFSYLWTNFIKGSDAVLLITESTLENVEKSKFFLELINEQAPNAHTSVIANKQDLDDAMKPEEIEEILGLKAYSMIAIDKDNRDKMIKIVADILEMDATISPLLKPLLERDEKMEKAQKALENEKFKIAANLFEDISDLCLDLGDDSLSNEFYTKAQKIKSMIQKAKERSLKEKPKEAPIKEKAKKEGEIKVKEEVEGKKEIKKKKLLKPKIKPITLSGSKVKMPFQQSPKEIAQEPSEEIPQELPEEVPEEPPEEVPQEPPEKIPQELPEEVPEEPPEKIPQELPEEVPEEPPEKIPQEPPEEVPEEPPEKIPQEPPEKIPQEPPEEVPQEPPEKIPQEPPEEVPEEPPEEVPQEPPEKIPQEPPEKIPQEPPEEVPQEPPEEVPQEPPEEVPEEPPEEIPEEPPEEIPEEPPEEGTREIEEIKREEFLEHPAEEELRLELNPEDFMVKKRSKKVSVVPKDAKNKLKTSSFGHVINPEKSVSIEKSNKETLEVKSKTSEVEKKEDKRAVAEIAPELKTSSEKEDTIISPQKEKEPQEIVEATNVVAQPSSKSSLKQKKTLESELMDLRIQKAKISKMLLDFEMKELSGEITEDELKQKSAKLSKMEERLNTQIKELEDLINE
jgi:small GTP-binding protein